MTSLRTSSAQFCLPFSAKGIFIPLFYLSDVCPPAFSLYFAVTTSTQASPSGGRRFSGGRDDFFARYSPPYDVTTYIHDISVYFEATRFSKLFNFDTALLVPYGTGARDKAVDTWRKRCKHWSGRRDSGSRDTGSDTDSPFASFREEDEYHRRLDGLLAGMGRRREVPNLVAADL